MNERFRNVLLAAAAIVAADLALAEAGRALLPDWDQRGHRQKVRISHPVYHHTLRSNMDLVDWWGGHQYRLATNSLGARDRSVREVAKVAAGPRLAVIGDSFTEGVGLPYDQTVAGLLQQALSPQGTEVVNFGVSSYSPVIYFKKVQTLLDVDGVTFDHLIVLVDPGDILNEAEWYALSPDGSRVLRNRPEGVNMRKPSPVQDWLAIHSVIGKAAITISDLIRARRKNAVAGGEEGRGLPSGWVAVVNSRDGAYTFDDHAWENWGRRGMELTLTHLRRLKDVTDAHGVRLSIAAYPWPGQLWHGQRQSRHSLALKEWCAANGAAFLDLYPPFFAVDRNAALERWFVPSDVHWNAAGNRLVADEVLRLIAAGRK